MDPRFSNKIPVVAYIIHKCLSQWHAFDIDNDKIISRLISTFDLFAKVRTFTTLSNFVLITSS